MARLVPWPTTSSALPSASAERIACSTSAASRGLSVSAMARSFRRVGDGRGTGEGRHDLARKTAQLRAAAGDGEQDIGHAGFLQSLEVRADLIRRAEQRVLLGAAGLVGIGKHMRAAFAR